MTTIQQIDAYIAKSQPFAQPILNHFRALVHKVCPNVEEKIKWGFPHFDYKGQMLCSMASFKQHCAIGFWKASLIDPQLEAKAKTEEAMGHLGKITTLTDLPSDAQLRSYIKAAMKLNDQGITVKKEKPVAKKLPEPPAELTAAVQKNKKAKLCWEQFSASHKREYIEWITEAKTEATRNKRIATTVEWLSEGKSRNWKYK